MDVVVTESSAVFQLLSGEDESLLVWRDSFLILDLGFDILDQSLTTPSRLDGDRLGVDSRVNENDPRAVIKIRLHGDLETFGRARLSCLGRVLDCEEIAGTRISLVFTQLKDKKGT